MSGTASSERDLGVGVDVVLGLGDILDEHGLALDDGLADDTLAGLDAHPFDLSVEWPLWKRMRSSWVRSLSSRMARMR